MGVSRDCRFFEYSVLSHEWVKLQTSNFVHTYPANTLTWVPHGSRHVTYPGPGGDSHVGPTPFCPRGPHGPRVRVPAGQPVRVPARNSARSHVGPWRQIRSDGWGRTLLPFPSCPFFFLPPPLEVQVFLDCL